MLIYGSMIVVVVLIVIIHLVLGGTVVSTNIVYTYNVDSYVEDGKYVVVVNKYLFSNSYAEVTGNDSSKVYIYGDYNSAVKGSCMDC